MLTQAKISRFLEVEQETYKELTEEALQIVIEPSKGGRSLTGLIANSEMDF